MTRWPASRLRAGVAAATAAIGLILVGATSWRFDSDVKAASIRAARASTLVSTRCGPIEYEEAGAGIPLLVVHGSGGGHDQGMAFAGALAQRGVRVVAMSRFGYLRTPMPADATPAAQADAHACLLDALGIGKAAVLGGSAGGPSAMQLAIRHPDRVSALVLVVPLAYKPGTVGDSAPRPSAAGEKWLMRLLGSDFLFWAALHVARDQVIRHVVATPPEQVAAASPQEQARVNAMLDNILPVSLRAEGLRSDTALSMHLAPMALETIRAPTLIFSSRDDGFGTYAGAQYTAGRIPGAKFVGWEHGGHVWVGHDDEIRREIRKLLAGANSP